MTGSEKIRDHSEKQHPDRSRLAPQLGVELIIGLVLATLLIVVGWASSNAIRFVYGGY